jgi:hypothetical protein
LAVQGTDRFICAVFYLKEDIMKKKYIKEITELFSSINNTINLVFENEFYTNTNKLLEVKKIMENWYNSFNATKSLINIKIADLEFINSEIIDFFDKYISTEPIDHNYAEILSYCFGILKKYWKDELEKGGKLNG